MANKFFITHGSNLNVLQMRLRCPNASIAGTAVLKDCCLTFQDSAAGISLTMEPRKGNQTPIAVWLVSDEEARGLNCRMAAIGVQFPAEKRSAEQTAEIFFCLFQDTGKKQSAGQHMQFLLEALASGKDVEA